MSICVHMLPATVGHEPMLEPGGDGWWHGTDEITPEGTSRERRVYAPPEPCAGSPLLMLAMRSTR